MVKSILIASLLIGATPVFSQGINPLKGSTLLPIPVAIQSPPTIQATFRHVQLNTEKGGIDRSLGSCPSVEVARTDSTFGNGTYTVQGGFAEGEILAASYDVSPDEFPIKIDLAEVMFATSNTNVETTTHWSVYVWEGTPDTGTLVANYSSDGIILPHLVMPPGTTGMIISVSVDPTDPDQIYIYNDSGQNKFTIGFGIDQHNNPGNPCISSPPSSSNAFPTTDNSGLDYPNENWIDAVSGSFCVCGTGWLTFQQLPNLCTPSGDWVLRSAYTPVNCSTDPAACCLTNNSCIDLTPSECESFGGSSQSAGTSCATFVCGSGIGACCVESTGNCVDFNLDMCNVVGGIHMGEGSTCASTTCFPQGACCLPDGNCIEPVSPENCGDVDGTFQGDDTSCSTVQCAQPIGACCGINWCLDINEADCSNVAGQWQGMDTLCENEDICSAPCPEDINGDGQINVTDLLEIVGAWGSNNPDLDLDGSGIVDTPDLLAVIAAWGVCG